MDKQEILKVIDSTSNFNAFIDGIDTLNDKGTEVLNETYDLMLEEYGVDKDKDYEILDDIIEDSANG